MIKRCFFEPFTSRICGVQLRKVKNKLIQELQLRPERKVPDSPGQQFVSCMEVDLYRFEVASLKHLASMVI